MGEPDRRANSNNLPSISLSVKQKYAKLAYHHLISNAFYIMLLPLLGTIFAQLSTLSYHDLVQFWNNLELHLASVTLCTGLVVFLATLFYMRRERKIYLVDFACYKPDASLKCSLERFLKLSRSRGVFTEENMEFQRKVIERSGLGQETYFPEPLVKMPPSESIADARQESSSVMFGAIDEVLRKTGVKVKDINILIVNCGMFTPTPSLSSMVVNHYKMKSNILSYNLGGMGCSASLISVDLAKQLLQLHPNTYALVVSLETITPSWYSGNDRSMLVTNCLFRHGGAAILLSNKSSERRRSKYELILTLRTNKSAEDKCYNCIVQKEDANKLVGVSLNKDLTSVAGAALKTNITTLGPLVLPISEQLLFLWTIVARKIFNMKVKEYVPDFKLAFEHFCIHAGGRGVLDAVEKNLNLTEWHMEPSRMTLYRFGNTSSSSLWYELAYSEAKGRIKKGDRIWQIAFGSGFKCNSGVWHAIRTINPTKEKNPWTEEIAKFPVQVPKVMAVNTSSE